MSERHRNDCIERSSQWLKLVYSLGKKLNELRWNMEVGYIFQDPTCLRRVDELSAEIVLQVFDIAPAIAVELASASRQVRDEFQAELRQCDNPAGSRKRCEESLRDDIRNYTYQDIGLRRQETRKAILRRVHTIYQEAVTQTAGRLPVLQCTICELGQAVDQAVRPLDAWRYMFIPAGTIVHWLRMAWSPLGTYDLILHRPRSVDYAAAVPAAEGMFSLDDYANHVPQQGTICLTPEWTQTITRAFERLVQECPSAKLRALQSFSIDDPSDAAACVERCAFQQMGKIAILVADGKLAGTPILANAPIVKPAWLKAFTEYQYALKKTHAPLTYNKAYDYLKDNGCSDPEYDLPKKETFSDYISKRVGAMKPRE